MTIINTSLVIKKKGWLNFEHNFKRTWVNCFSSLLLFSFVKLSPSLLLGQLFFLCEFYNLSSGQSCCILGNLHETTQIKLVTITPQKV